ncbi:MAG: 4-hydroxythreonine-4-phosphate dehydrogenase PdxA [Desulfobacteraceae bacterium 4572_35.1]|nr:MAG: 4-hydroxythreonine-4-phosphate dehydrogenase PdxA [Desulfobacteraceae bacterium 4572_35.1]
MHTTTAPPLIITMGDPAGIGPEIIIKAVISGKLDKVLLRLVVAGDVAIMQRAAALFSDNITMEDNGTEVCLRIDQRRLRINPMSQLQPEQIPFGQIQNVCGKAMLDYIEWACAQCRNGQAAAMITAPIHKEAIHAAGCEFPGHTELLAKRCGVEKVVMMLGGSRLKVCLVTTHMALRDVPDAVTAQELDATLRVTNAAFRSYFTGHNPKIAVLALNPHAGEGGMFGDEEQRVIAPAIARALAAGMNVSGPHSADTLFHFAAQGQYDAVVCMYHDQGLIPLKLLHFDDGVNVTLGLPIIRTSVDHGTAYDVAGTGNASCASLIAAVEMAEEMAQKRAIGKEKNDDR